MTAAPAPAAPRGARSGLAALAVTVLLAVAPVVGGGFLVLDDPGYVTANPRVLSGLSLANLRWAATTGHAANWHPLTWLSHQLDVELWGLDARGHHATNLLLHAANALLAALALARLTGSPRRSLAVAALFALHPLRLESVAWIAERKDLLSALFFLLALLAHERWARRGGAARYLALLAAGAAAMAAKPMAVTLPGVLLLLDAWPLGRLRARPWRCLLEKLPLAALAAGTAWATLAVQTAGGAVAGAAELPLGARLAQAARAPFEYLGRTLWPFDLSVLYPHPDLPGGTPQAPLGALLAALALGAAVAAALAALARPAPGARGAVAVGALWYLGTLVPVLGLIQVGEQATADRYTYLPHLGLFLALVWPAAEAARRLRLPGRTSLLAACALLAALAARTSVQARVWRDSTTLLEASLAATPDNPVLLWLAAVEDHRAGRLDRAGARLARAIALRPLFAEARHALARVYRDLGRPREAERQLELALEIHPRYKPALLDLAAVREAAGERAAARALRERAAALDAARDAGAPAAAR